MLIFAGLRKRISLFKKRFSVQKIPIVKMADLSPEAYQALLLYAANVPEPIDLSLYRDENKEVA